jgi:hypothetical protein
MLIPISIGDRPNIPIADHPVFSFDKELGGREILIPDTDYLYFNYYEGFDDMDKNSYLSKQDHAIFVGSTTGNLGISIEKLKRGEIPRIKSALHFKNSEKVSFKISNICQCISLEVDEYIKNLGIVGEWRSWEDQLKYKLQISMDGNASTWSRMVRILKSHSALLKYDSRRVQFYYGSLIPGYHYIPISKDEDVERVVDLERKSPGRFESIAESGREFAKKHLHKDVIDEYTVELLRRYAALIK